MTPQELHTLINAILNESMSRKYEREGQGRYFSKELIPAHYFADEQFVTDLVKAVEKYMAVEKYSDPRVPVDIAKTVTKKGK